MNRLARAQDRKFEGSQGYALTRRLWLAEEELRLARSTISTLGAEVIYFLQRLCFPLSLTHTSVLAVATPTRPVDVASPDGGPLSRCPSHRFELHCKCSGCALVPTGLGVESTLIYRPFSFSGCTGCDSFGRRKPRIAAAAAAGALQAGHRSLLLVSRRTRAQVHDDRYDEEDRACRAMRRTAPE